MNDTANTAKATIADKIHQAVNSLLETELRLNRELAQERELVRKMEEHVDQLRAQLATEQDARKELERRISLIANTINGR